MKEEEEKNHTAKNGTKHKVALKLEWEQHYDYYFDCVVCWFFFPLLLSLQRRRQRWWWGGERERLSRTPTTRRHDNWCSGVSGTDGLHSTVKDEERREKWNLCMLLSVYNFVHFLSAVWNKFPFQLTQFLLHAHHKNVRVFYITDAFKKWSSHLFSIISCWWEFFL